MNPRLEHANLVVRDVDAMLRFLTVAFPEFSVRFDGRDSDGRRWVHVGTEASYVALNQATVEPGEDRVPYSGKPGVDHLGYEVGDVEALRRRMIEAGYRDTTVDNAHAHRKRVYFSDPEGNDREFVQYLSMDPAERNDYELPDAPG